MVNNNKSTKQILYTRYLPDLTKILKLNRWSCLEFLAYSESNILSCLNNIEKFGNKLFIT